MKAKLIVAFCALLALAGCGVLEQVEENPNSVKFVTQYATLKYVESGSGVDVEKARETHAKAVEIREYLTADAVVDVDTLVDHIESRVDWAKLSPADTVAARALIEYLAVELDERLPDTAGAQERLVAVKDLLDIVIETLEVYI